MFKNLFKGKSKKPHNLIEQLLQQLLESGGFLLSMEVTQKSETEIFIEIFGEDEELLIAKEGQLLLALQIYLNRVMQHYFYGQNIFIRLDSGNFFKDKEDQLLDLAEDLKQKALSSGEPVYFKKALSPFQRRKVHQLLTENKEVTTSSQGDGFYKIICITPANYKKSF